MNVRRAVLRWIARPLALTPLLALMLLGLSATLWFAQVQSAWNDPPASADGIVVLTGGADRLATALRLLADGRGPILLVSGVGGAARLTDVLRHSGVDSSTRHRAPMDRVTLGRSAASTYGNAQETADWARAHDAHSLIVVTANYHMPRAILELSRAMPDVTLYPVAVQPPAPSGLAQWRLLADEYAKWLVAWAGLSRFAQPRPTAALARTAPGPA